MINNLLKLSILSLSLCSHLSAALIGQWSFDNAEMPTSSPASGGFNGGFETVNSILDCRLWGSSQRHYNNTSIPASPAGGGILYGDPTGANNDPHTTSELAPPVAGSDRSVAFWMRSAGAQPHAGVMFNYGSETASQKFAISTTGGQLKFDISGDSRQGTVAGINLEDGSWHHVAVVLSDTDGDSSLEIGDAQLYIDGQLITGLATDGATLNTVHTGGNSRVCFGNVLSSRAVSGFYGSLDEILIYDNALTAMEVQALANPGAPPAQGDYVWTAGGDGEDIFQEANWTIVGGNSFIPQIDSGVPVGYDLLVESGTVGGESGFGAGLQLNGHTLTITGGSVITSSGIHNDGTSGGGKSPIVIQGGLLSATFLVDQEISITGDSRLVLQGGGNSLNNSTVDIQSPFLGEIHFTSETTTNVTNEHLSKITVDGVAAQVGININLISDGLSGAIINTAIDSDSDNMPDNYEQVVFGNLSRDGTGDLDGDTISDYDEYVGLTDPTKADTDGDTINDNVELAAGTDPLKTDTDGDGLADNVETGTGIYVSATDTGTDPLDVNSDNDRGADGVEVARGFDPNDPSSQPNLPNIIFVLADDLGYGELGCYGQTKILTPNLDAIASEGMKFTNFYAGCAVCAPTRAMLMTGKHAGRAYIRNNGDTGLPASYQFPLSSESLTIPEMLKDAGYVTSAIGKWGMGGPGTSGDPLNQGFDHFYGYLGQWQAHHYYPSYQWRTGERAFLSASLAATHGTNVDVPGAANDTGFDDIEYSRGNKLNNGNVHSHDAETKEAMDWITANKDTPFFMYLAYAIPHTSVQAPGHIDDITDADGLVFTNDRGGNTGRTCVDEFYPTRPFGAPIYAAGTGHYTHTDDKRHEYAAMISAMDRDIGRIEDLLASLGLTDDTIIIFTSDNGPWKANEVDWAYFNSTGGLRGGKANLYEGGIREPFIIKWPGKIAPNTTSGLIAHHDDVMATLADITGTAASSDTTGRSILPTLFSEPAECQQIRDYLYWEFSASSGWTRAVRKGDWKLYRVVNKTTGVVTTDELYNLITDPNETTNVKSVNPSIHENLSRIMDAAHETSGVQRYFRPTDEFPIRNGVTVSYASLGMRLDGTGEVLVPILEDITKQVTFKLAIDPTSSGTNSNGAFLFGEGTNVSDLVKVEVDEDAGVYRITHGAQTVTTPITGSLNAHHELRVTWNPATSTVTLVQGASTLDLVLTSPPAKIDHIGYAVNDSITDFRPATLHLTLAVLPKTSELSEKNGTWEFLYSRPADAEGEYVMKKSTDLQTWSIYKPIRERSVVEFGNVKKVIVELPDLGSNSAPREFYRVEYVPPQ